MKYESESSQEPLRKEAEGTLEKKELARKLTRDKLKTSGSCRVFKNKQ